MNNDLRKSDFAKWAIAQHEQTNHLYDGSPYELHLGMAVREGYRFRDLLPKVAPELNPITRLDTVINGIWGHDLIEDTRVTYNDIHRAGAGYDTANMIYALTNFRGKDRSERAPKEYYDLIRATQGATYGKLCDRIANVKYGVMMGQLKMVDVYKKEHAHFIESLIDDTAYLPMTESLNRLFQLAGTL